MKTRIGMLIAGIAVACVALVALAPAVMAQGMGNRTGTGPAMMMPRSSGPMMGGAAMMGRSASLVAIAAEALSMDEAAMIAELQAGKTIADLAAARNVALDTIVDAFVAVRADRLAARVAAGNLTQAQADAMLATLRANVTARLSQPWSAQGPGMGAGFVDADGDGVCDHMGAGPGMGHGHGRMGQGGMCQGGMCQADR